MKRGGKLYIRIFPDKPITKKPVETRMGNGKGGVEDWVAVVQAGPRDVRARRRRTRSWRARRSTSPHHKLPVADPARRAGGCTVSKSSKDLQDLRELAEDELTAR